MKVIVIGEHSEIFEKQEFFFEWAFLFYLARSMQVDSLTLWKNCSGGSETASVTLLVKFRFKREGPYSSFSEGTPCLIVLTAK